MLESVKRGLKYSITMLTILAISLSTLSILTKYHTTHLYLDPVIDFTPTEHQVIDTLNNASSGQNIVLHVNSLGGGVVPMMELVTAVQTTKANLVIKIDGLAASAAGIIAMARPEAIELGPQSIFMIHLVIGGDGKMIDSSNHEGITYMLDQMIYKEYKGILTPFEEFNISIGGQVFLDAPTFAKRLCDGRGICNVLK